MERDAIREDDFNPANTTTKAYIEAEGLKVAECNVELNQDAYNLLKKIVECDWTLDHQKQFEEIKNIVKSNQVHIFNPQQDYFL